MPRADIAILTVIPEEYEAVIASLSSYGCNTEYDLGSSTAPNQFGWVTGELRGSGDQVYRLVVGIVVQPGPARMATAVSATCARYRPQYVLIVGIAGGFPQDGLTKGDVAISSVIYDYDYGKVATDFQPRMDFTYQPDQTLLTSAVSLHARDKSWAQRDKQVRPDGGDAVPKLLQGAIASGGKVVDDATNDFFAAVLKAWPKLLAVEMEGAGAAAAILTAQAARQSVGFLMVRGISDMPKMGDGAQSAPTGPEGNKAERDKWKRYAATTAANFTIYWISRAWPLAPILDEYSSGPTAGKGGDAQAEDGGDAEGGPGGDGGVVGSGGAGGNAKAKGKRSRARGGPGGRGYMGNGGNGTDAEASHGGFSMGGEGGGGAEPDGRGGRGGRSGAQLLGGGIPYQELIDLVTPIPGQGHTSPLSIEEVRKRLEERKLPWRVEAVEGGNYRFTSTEDKGRNEPR